MYDMENATFAQGNNVKSQSFYYHIEKVTLFDCLYEQAEITRH